MPSETPWLLDDDEREEIENGLAYSTYKGEGPLIPGRATFDACFGEAICEAQALKLMRYIEGDSLRKAQVRAWAIKAANNAPK